MNTVYPCEDLTIILPTLNEQDNIKRLLEYFTSRYKDARIIVTDDGSDDKTKEIVMKLNSNKILFLDRKNYKKHGLCISILDAIKLVKTKYFVVIDADGQHPAEKIIDILRSLRAGYDLALGTRTKVEGRWSLLRKIISYAGTFMGNLSLLIRNKKLLTYDILTGFFGAETDFWNKVVSDNSNKFRLGGYKIAFDFLKIAPAKSKISQVHYKFNARGGGASKANMRIYLEYLKSVFS